MTQFSPSGVAEAVQVLRADGYDDPGADPHLFDILNQMPINLTAHDPTR